MLTCFFKTVQQHAHNHDLGRPVVVAQLNCSQTAVKLKLNRNGIIVVTAVLLIQETRLSLTNRVTHLLILNFQKYRDLQTGVRVTEGHWNCHHSIQCMRLPIDVQW